MFWKDLSKLPVLSPALFFCTRRESIDSVEQDHLVVLTEDANKRLAYCIQMLNCDLQELAKIYFDPRNWRLFELLQYWIKCLDCPKPFRAWIGQRGSGPFGFRLDSPNEWEPVFAESPTRLVPFWSCFLPNDPKIVAMYVVSLLPKRPKGSLIVVTSLYDIYYQFVSSGSDLTITVYTGLYGKKHHFCV